MAGGPPTFKISQKIKNKKFLLKIKNKKIEIFSCSIPCLRALSQSSFSFFFFFPETFHVWRAPSHNLSTEAMAGGPPDMECFKKKFQDFNFNLI
jgi:hypothetical protein